MLRISFKDFIKYGNKNLEYYDSKNKIYLLNLLDLYKSILYENDKEKIKEFLLKEMEKEFYKFQNEIRENFKYIYMDDFFEEIFNILNINKIGKIEVETLKEEYENMKNRILELEFLLKEKESKDIPF